MDINNDISELKGVGAKSKELLNKCKIINIVDLLLYFPRDYEKIIFSKNINEIDSEDKVIIKAFVCGILNDVRSKNGRVISTIVFGDGTNKFKCKWFNQPYIKNKFKYMNNYVIMGKVEKYAGEITLVNPEIVSNSEIVENYNRFYEKGTEEFQSYKLVAKYALREGITNNFIIKLVAQVLSSVTIIENMPNYIINKYSLCSLDKAIKNIHSPKGYEELNEALKRLKFQELFTYSMKILLLKEYLNQNKEGIAFKISEELKFLKEKLPFQLTNAQSKVLREILLEQKKSTPMNRLVQGDVGSGKTIVAIIAMFNVVKNGYQAAIMAPTEILANQHMSEINKILEGFNIKIKLLCGSLSKKDKEKVKDELKEGKIDILVGTHAILEDDVEFNNLGMVVTDEQHRFGVGQRSKFLNKGRNIDVLVMTATPIPRTLALYLYGDLDVSVIDELPPGRQKIQTFYEKENSKSKVYKFAMQEVNKGRQAYVVCPLIEENEELSLNSVENLYKDLKSKYFPNIQIEMLHGKMSPKLKENIMNKFAAGETKVLISTTVIEVGINVPNATLMIVENAERFGLSQLHQLRGRVGRGNEQSYCILIAAMKNDTVRKRMEIMKNSNDGFYISEQDLKLRGSGEIFGFKQHGEDELLLTDIFDNMELLKIANGEAKKVIGSDDPDDIRIKNEIFKKIENGSKLICFN